MAYRLALAALAADRADAVALRVDAPPPEVRAEPLRGHRVPAFAREPLDVGIGFPRIQLTLAPLDPLRLRLFHGFAHRCLQKQKAGRRALCRPSSRPVSFDFDVAYEGVTSPVYRSGTCTHALHRAHLAVTRPVGKSTLMMALWITTSSWSATTTLARHTGQRSDIACSPCVLMPIDGKLHIVDQDGKE